MTVTSTFDVATFGYPDVTVESDGVAVTGMTDGDFAIGDDVNGVVTLQQEWAFGAQDPYAFGAPMPALAALSGGGFVAVGIDGSGDLDYLVGTAVDTLGPHGSIAAPRESAASVAGLHGGGFVVADQRDLGQGLSGIEVHLRSASGGAIADIAVTGQLQPQINQAPSVAALSNGGFAVAWTQTESDGGTQIWDAVYNADGSVRAAPRAVDSIGSVNQDVQACADPNGGFALVYDDNGWNTGNQQITLARFENSGALDFYTDISANVGTGTDQSQASIAWDQGGFLVGFSNGQGGTLGEVVSSDGATVLSDTALDFGAGTLESFAFMEGFGLLSVATGAGQTTLEQRGLVHEIAGDDGDDVIHGDAFGDDISTGGGRNVVDGGAGDDDVQGGPGTDLLNGGGGSNTLDYSAATAGVTVSLGIMTAQNTGGAGTDTLKNFQNITGSAFNDHLTLGNTGGFANGDGGNDVITGGAGSDSMLAQSGNSHLYGLGGNDSFDIEGGGHDIVSGGSGIDDVFFFGTTGVHVDLGITQRQDIGDGTVTMTGVENLHGTRQNDTLTGNSGANIISGGNGADILTGGGGNDTFLYYALSNSTVAASGRDTITDVTAGDRIDLHLIDANTGFAGNNAFSFIGDKAFDHHAGELRAVISGSHTLVSADVTGDGVADFSVLLKGQIALTASSFIL